MLLNKWQISSIDWVVEELNIFLFYDIILLFSQDPCILQSLFSGYDERLASHIFFHKYQPHSSEQLFILVT